MKGEKKMKIGFDIDDTITNSSEVFVKYATQYNYLKSIKFPINTNELDLTLAFGWDEENKKEFNKLYLKKVLNEAIPNKDVISVINCLKKQGNMIFLITARNNSEISNMYSITKKWLIKNQVNYDYLFINCADKLTVCVKNDIDVFVDDNISTCKNIYENSKTNVLIYTTKYNQNINTKFMRVFNWKEIQMYITKLKKERIL